MTIIKDLKLEVIATFNDHDQEMFTITKIYKDNLKSEESLLNTIKGLCKRPSFELIKLSLCWISENFEKHEKSEAVAKTLEKNGKYFFNIERGY